MKKTISIMLCLLLIFSSVSSVFASATSWDTTDQANLQSIKNSVNSGGSLYSVMNQIKNSVISGGALYNLINAINSNILGLLQYDDADVGRTSVTYWVREAVLDLDQLVGSGSGTLLYYLSNINTNVSTIKDRLQLVYDKVDAIRQTSIMIHENVDDIATDINTSLGYQVGILGHQNNIDTITNTYLPYLDPLQMALTNYKNGDNWSDVTAASVRLFAHRQLISNLATGEYNHMNVTNTGATNTSTRKWGLGTPLGNIALILEGLNSNFVNAYTFENGGFNSNRNYVNWQTLQAGNRTPTSAINGIYNWLADIQIPIARLAYVHASDEEIEARDKAAANQEAVVDNFIDSTGSGAAPASSFGDVASMSAGYTSNMNTNASASGIWNIFNSNNFGWFSQETANQLDTTVSTRRGSSDFETPLLDQQIADIYKELGVDVND